MNKESTGKCEQWQCLGSICWREELYRYMVGTPRLQIISYGLSLPYSGNTHTQLRVEDRLE